MIRLATLAAALLSSAVLAQSVPGNVSFNARLTDTAGAPITGAHTLTFGLFTQSTGGAAVWTETQAGATFSSDGLVYAELGSVTPLTTAALDGNRMFLEIAVDGTTMTPRLAIVSVPYAIRASVAASALSVGTLTESLIQRRITGVCSTGAAIRSIDASGGVQCETFGAGGITGVTAGAGLSGGGTTGAVTVGLMSCANGEILSSTGAGWQCAAPPAFNGVYTGNSSFTGNSTFTGDVTITGTLNATVASPLGESKANPAANCSALLTARPGLPSGVYWVRPSSSTVAFRVYCDMVTEGGGWTLVWSNLRAGRGKPFTDLQWLQAVNTLPRFSGAELSEDLESFTQYTGIKHFMPLAPGGLMRYDWATDFGQPVTQRRACPFQLIPTSNYQLTFDTANCTVGLGNVLADLFTYHNNRAFSAVDRDLDANAANCAAAHGGAPFWYNSCWAGSIWGGGEFAASYPNGAYWSGSDGSFATTANGTGAGNGWLYVK